METNLSKLWSESGNILNQQKEKNVGKFFFQKLFPLKFQNAKFKLRFFE